MIVSYAGHTPSLAPSAFVAPNATLIGRVTLGAEASVFYGSVLRGDTDSITIGARSNVQDNVSMHTDTGLQLVVGEGVSIGHGAVVHGCVIEDDCLIGMGARVLNRAVVGAGSLVAAGAVVLEGTVIPPGSLVAGVPAKVRRELTEDERAGIRHNADHYVELAAAHRVATA
ncbi:gamma carbonic anhydrase family protein [Galbitalea soli]|uniref:Gamma carbonic anhydrase family protein n=1 Tax=Galbitalea soli TaxID=1268042 RepID=A0A7C9PNH4_9MICO|nr:gamma carbonic anhydrase family protein [Galbitalea soli]NEM91547.1 gamma carbonic anhydrase family protein [Galbitalea soli]NYJ30241.1 carbonic anhydrase/acetyltransferase-like protein (isoleucine patch superfamily) [Galbitalea soli]